MEYAIGFIVGLVVAVLAGVIAAYFFFRDKTPPVEVPPPPPPSPAPTAITGLVTEPFVNKQLEQILVSDDPSNPGNRPLVPQSFGPIKVKLVGASIKLLPDRRARLTVQLAATAIGVRLNLRPVTEFAFLPQPGRVRILITRILLEGVAIPRQWVDSFLSAYVASAEEQLNHYLRLIQDAANVSLSDLETDGELLILKFS